MMPLPSLAQLWALARRIPGIAWVMLFAASLAVAGWCAAVHIGEVRGETKVHRAAVADSIVVVKTVQKQARAKSDSIGRVATRVRTSADSGRAATRAIIAAHLAETSPIVVQAVSAQIERDSLAQAVDVAHAGSLLAERPVADTLDRLRINQGAIGVPQPNLHWKAYVVGGAMLGAGVVITILHFVR